MKRRLLRTPATVALAALMILLQSAALPSVARDFPRGGHSSAGSPEPFRTWYFAEGTTRAGFSEYVSILNPGDEPTGVEVAFLLESGERVVTYQSVPAGCRLTVDAGSIVTGEHDVSSVIRSQEPVVAERSVYFTYHGAWEGGHCSGGVRAPREKWYFAEGCTRSGFDTYICIMNPSDRTAELDIRYFCGDGATETRRRVVLAGGRRTTVAVHDEEMGVGRRDGPEGDVSVLVESSNGAPVVAERTVYFSRGPYLDGGHSAVGAGKPAEEWYFAEGCTRSGFDTYLCIGNPGASEARVVIDYFCGDGSSETRSGVKVPRRNRLTVAVHEPGLGLGRSEGERGDVSMRVRSANGVPVVAERPMYFTYRPFWSGGHCALGETSARERWYFAEGCSRNGFDTYITVGNPGEHTAVVDLAYHCADGRTEVKSGLEVGPRSRLTVPAHDASVGVGRSDDGHSDFGVMVKSRGGAPVVAERSVYFAPYWWTIDKDALAAAWGWGEVWRGNAGKRQIALTFDMETSGSLASSVLDILEQKDVRCTMFVTGGFPGSYPDMILRMAGEGHEIANHSMSHSVFTRLSGPQINAELASTDAAVTTITGRTTRPYFRFPYGDRNASTIARVSSHGYLSVRWTIDPQEWRSGVSAETVRGIVRSQARNGAIVLLHDRANTVRALPGIIDDLRGMGYETVTLTELLYPGP